MISFFHKAYSTGKAMVIAMPGTGERIRDKIAGSKKKGMWMGGLASLGYDADDRKLVVNAREAETVRHIYRRYAELGAVRLN